MVACNACPVRHEDGTRTKRTGDPDPAEISTSYVERQNLTPAMAAGVADHVWTLREIAALLDSN